MIDHRRAARYTSPSSDGPTHDDLVVVIGRILRRNRHGPGERIRELLVVLDVHVLIAIEVEELASGRRRAGVRAGETGLENGEVGEVGERVAGDVAVAGPKPRADVGGRPGPLKKGGPNQLRRGG